MKKYLLLPLLIFVLCYIFYSSYYKTVPISYEDEGYWIGNSYYFDLLIKRDLNNPLWQGYYSIDQQKLTSYLYGLILYPLFLQKKTQINNPHYDLAMFLIDNNFYEINGRLYKDYKNNKKDFINWYTTQQNLSPEKLLKQYGNDFQKTLDIIFYVRKINVLLLAITAIIIYLIAVIATNYPIALTITVFYALNSLIIQSSLKAQAEGLFLFLFNLNILLLLMIFNRKKQNYVLLVLYSFITALLIHTKLNGAMLFIFFFFLMTAKILKQIIDKKYKQGIIDMKKLLFVAITTFFIFVLLYPYLYRNPIVNTLEMFKYRFKEARYGGTLYPQTILPTFMSRIRAIYANFPLFSNLVIIKTPHSWLLSLYFFVIGIFVGISQIIKKKSIFTPIGILFTCCLSIQIIMGAYLYLNWPRYYVQLVFFFAFFQSAGLWYILQLIYYETTKTKLFSLVTTGKNK